jgi:hypothetical protein
MLQRLIPAVLALAPLAASAELVSFQFSGYVDKAQAYGSANSAPLVVGSGFTGTFSYELVDGWQSLPASSDLGAFFSRLAWQLEFDSGHQASFGVPFQTMPYPVGNDAVVGNDGHPLWNLGNAAQDSILLGSVALPVGPAMSEVTTSLPNAGLLSFGFGFFDETLTALSSGAVTPADFALTDFGNIQWFIDVGDVGLLGGRSTDDWQGYQLRGAVTAFTAVPLPAGLPLLGSALLGLLIVKAGARRA